MEYPTWEGIVERDGVSLVDSVRLGSYQGDLYMIVRRGVEFGWIDLCYGSCSGCDELEDACGDKSKIDEIAARVLGSVDWKSHSDLLKWIDERDWKAQPGASYYGDEQTQAVAKLRASLVYAKPEGR